MLEYTRILAIYYDGSFYLRANAISLSVAVIATAAPCVTETGSDGNDYDNADDGVVIAVFVTFVFVVVVEVAVCIAAAAVASAAEASTHHRPRGHRPCRPRVLCRGLSRTGGRGFRR